MGDRSEAIPLTTFQREIARLLARNRTPDSYLAGGAALHIEPRSTRYSNDLDYFHDSEERVAAAFAEDRVLLEEAGCTIEVQLNQPGHIRAVVSRGSEATKIEWAHDSAWRFLPPVKSRVAGYQLHPVDLAVNKLLALVGRDEPRDFLDVLELHRKTLSLGALCWAAAGKDPGFTPSTLLELLKRRGRIREEDLDRLHLRRRPQLTALKSQWLEALAEAETFIAERPPDEVGCLYWSPSAQRFVDRLDDTDGVVPHFGRPGGVLPRMMEVEG